MLSLANWHPGTAKKTASVIRKRHQLDSGTGEISGLVCLDKLVHFIAYALQIRLGKLGIGAHAFAFVSQGSGNERGEHCHGDILEKMVFLDIAAKRESIYAYSINF